MIRDIWYSVRGGTWYNPSSFARASYRDDYTSTNHSRFVGLRCARKGTPR